MSDKVFQTDIGEISDLYPFEHIVEKKEKNLDYINAESLLRKVKHDHFGKSISKEADAELSAVLDTKDHLKQASADKIVLASINSEADFFEKPRPFYITIISRTMQSRKYFGANKGIYKLVLPYGISMPATEALKDVLRAKELTPYHIVKLLENGADANCVCNENGEIPLHVCIRNSDIISVKYLLEAGSNINALNIEKQTPFMIACASYTIPDYVPIVKLLLQQKKIDVISFDNTGNTAISLAIQHNNINIIRELLLYGVEVSIKIPPYSSPYEISLLHYSKNLRTDINSIKNKIQIIERNIHLPRGASSDLSYLSPIIIFIELLTKTKSEIIFRMIHHKKLLEEQSHRLKMKLSERLNIDIKDNIDMTEKLKNNNNRSHNNKIRSESETDNNDNSDRRPATTTNDDDYTTTTISERDKRRLRKHQKLLAARLRREEEQQARWIRIRDGTTSTVEKQYNGSLTRKNPTAIGTPSGSATIDNNIVTDKINNRKEQMTKPPLPKNRNNTRNIPPTSTSTSSLTTKSTSTLNKKEFKKPRSQSSSLSPSPSPSSSFTEIPLCSENSSRSSSVGNILSVASVDMDKIRHDANGVMTSMRMMSTDGELIKDFSAMNNIHDNNYEDDFDL
eukprot:gene6105-12358_t